MRAYELAWIATFFFASAAGAGASEGDAVEETIESLDARVTSLSGRVVTIDRGTSAGLQAGDRVRFYPRGAAAIEGVVRTVELERAQVELEQIEPALDLGARAEVLLPSDRMQRWRAQEEELPAPAIPEHPPWQQPIEAWQEGAPLLAPAKSPEPEERESDLHGRAYTRFDYTDDRQGEGRTYLRSLTGLDFDWSNPFGQGGRLQFDGEYSYRDAQVFADGDTESIARIERLSYALGGIPGRPNRYEVGRFLSSEFPELGVIDGFEFVHRPEAGHRFGASFGYLPEPFDEMTTGQDLAANVFYRYVSDEDERFAVGGAYQHTWHEGDPDRDLVIGTMDWRITDATSFTGSAWVDLYGPDELVKPEGAQLTELHVRLDHRFDSAGVGLFASQVRWPDVKRDELPPTTATSVADNDVKRVGADGWDQLTKHLRLGARVEGWEDQVASGVNAELRCGLRDLLWKQGALDFVLFSTQGRFSDGLGGRVSALRWFGPTAVRLSYEATNYDQNDFFGAQASLLQQAVRAGFDTVFGRDWNLSVDAETRFGDEQDSYSFGFTLQRSF